ncbi:MAG TPA: hypothetical protein PLI17_01250 [Denitromonas sp.]|nr:hypothetical protein [Denitromonas sp.]
MPTVRRRRAGRFILWLTAIAVLVSGLLVWQFSDRWLGATLAEQINARVAGQVSIDGTVSLQVFPPRLSLSGLAWQGPGATPGSMRIEHLDVSSDWSADGAARPLSVVIRGVRGELRQQADGQWQLPTPLSTADAGTDDAPVKLAALTVTDATLDIIGGGAPATLRLAELKLLESPSGWQAHATAGATRAGAAIDGKLDTTIELATAGPRLADLTITLAGQMGSARIESLALSLATVAPAADGAWQLAGLTAELRATDGARQLTLSGTADTGRYADGGAQVLGLQATAMLTPAGPSESATATFTGVDLALAGQQLTASGKAQFATTLAADPVAATVEDFQLIAELATGRIDARLPKLNATLADPAKPGAQITVDAALTGHWQLAERSGAGTVDATVEDSRLKGQWQIALEQPHWLALDAQVDRLNLDRWQAPGPRKAEALPLDAWRDWPLRLDLQVGRLRMQGIEAHNTRLRLNLP